MSAVDRALEVFRAYSKTGETGETGETTQNKSNKTNKSNELAFVSLVSPSTKTGETGETLNNRVKSDTYQSVSPVTPVSPQNEQVPQTENPGLFPYAGALNELETRCPDYVEPERWRLCIDDAQRFVADWGDKAQALGWTGPDLFALRTPPAHPHPSYSRLSRHDATGLLWTLQGHRVIALSSDTAAVATSSGSLTYRKPR